MNRRARAIIISFVVTTLAACAGAKPTPTPYHLKESARLQGEGGKAMAYGDYNRALQLAEAAYGRALSIDRVDEAVDALISQGVLLRRLDRRDEAMAVVDAGWGLIVDDRAMGYKPADQTDYDDEAIRLSILGADLALDANDTPTAELWLKRGEMPCGDCFERGAFLNLRARLKWALGSPVEANALAKEALSVNGRNGNRLEQGHSLRLLGRWSDDPAKAKSHFMVALAIDRELAIPSLIIDDLVGVGESYRRGGEEASALRYFRRAGKIARAIGDEKRASLCEALLTLGSPLPHQ